MSLEAFPTDPLLPQLKIASDPGLMLEVFRKHLRPVVGKDYHIQGCILSRIRYRRAERCVLQYTLYLVEPGTGRKRSQWVTGVIYAEDRVGRIWKKLRAAYPGQKIPEAFLTFEPISLIPDLSMLVQVFPYDRRLPTLPLLMAEPSPDLESLFLSGFGPGDWHTELWNVRPVRYRAGLGAALQYTLKARDAGTRRRGEKRFYVKVYRDEEGEGIYSVLRALWGRAEAGGESFTVGKPIAYLDGIHAIVLEEAPGTSLQKLILEGYDTEVAMREIARALAVFNQHEVATTRRHSTEDEIYDVRRAGELLQWACPRLRAEVDAIVSAVTLGLEEVPLGPTHRDLKADHILLDGDRVIFLDLDSFAGADPVLDPAHLLARLAAMPNRFPVPRSRVQTAATAFAEEYFAHVPRAWRQRLPLHYAGAALEAAASLFRNQEPGWSEKMVMLVDEAKGSLGGRLWR